MPSKATRPMAYRSKERGKRCNETLEIMTNLWTGEPYTFNGQFSQVLHDYSPRRPALPATPSHPSGSAATPRPSSEGRAGGATASSPPTPTPQKPPRCTTRLTDTAGSGVGRTGNSPMPSTSIVHFAESGEKAQSEARAHPRRTLHLPRFPRPCGCELCGGNTVEQCVRAFSRSTRP